MKIFKYTYKIIFFLLLLLLLFITSISIYLYVNKDKIIRQIKKQSKNQFGLDISFTHTSLKFNIKGPTIGLLIENIHLSKTINKKNKSLVSAKQFYCTFNIFNLIRKRYKIDLLKLSDGNIFITFINNKKNNKKNFNLDLSLFGLDNVYLNNISLTIYNLKKQIKNNIFAKNIYAQFYLSNNKINCKLDGKARIKSLKYKNNTYAKNVPIILNTQTNYDLNKKVLTIKNTDLNINKIPLYLNGIFYINNKWLDIHIKSNSADISKICQILPYNLVYKISYYNPKGNARLFLKLKGKFDENNFPALSLESKIKNMALSNIKTSSNIILSNVHSTLHIPDIYNLSSANLKLNINKVILGDKSMKTSIIIDNFYAFNMQNKFEGSINLSELNRFINKEDIFFDGNANIKLDIDCELYNVIKKYDNNTLNVNGYIALQNNKFRYKTFDFKNINGLLEINQNNIFTKKIGIDLNKNSFNIKINKSNILEYLIFADKKLYIDSFLEAELVDFNKLYTFIARNSDNKGFSLSPFLDLDININFGKVLAYKLISNNLSGHIKVFNKEIQINILSTIIGGGKFSSQSKITFEKNNGKITTNAKLRKVDLSKFFYMCNNFGQNFITDKNIKGNIFSDVDFTIYLNKNFSPIWKSLVANINFVINQGQLIHFKPLKHIEKYIDKKDMEKISFPTLKNKIDIKNRIVNIPKMIVQSSIVQLIVSGKHTFDNTISYNFVLPLRKNFKKNYDDPISNKYKRQDLSGLRLFLKLEGPVKNYKVSYSLVDSITKEITEQTKNLGKIIIGSYKKEKKHKKLSPDKYFDFD